MLALHQSPPRRWILMQDLVVGAGLQVAENLRRGAGSTVHDQAVEYQLAF